MAEFRKFAARNSVIMATKALGKIFGTKFFSSVAFQKINVASNYLLKRRKCDFSTFAMNKRRSGAEKRSCPNFSIRPFCNISNHSVALLNCINLKTRNVSQDTIKRSINDQLFSFYHINQNELCYTEKMNEFKEMVLKDFVLVENFISTTEEEILTKEVEKALARLKYEYDHWDGVIYGYREIEKSRWNSDAKRIIQKLKDFAFDEQAVMLPAVHVLDLSCDGYIKPHIDSKFCGRRIAGISLLSSAIMRLKPENGGNEFVDVLLKPRSLYIMKDRVRYSLTHEVLSQETSLWMGAKLPRDRRIAVIMREEPTP